MVAGAAAVKTATSSIPASGQPSLSCSILRPPAVSEIAAMQVKEDLKYWRLGWCVSHSFDVWDAGIYRFGGM